MFRVGSTGSFKNIERFLKKSPSNTYFGLEALAQRGVDALASATPVDSGLTANSWTYSINRDKTGVTIEWHNTNVNDGANVAILLQYGHGTGTGGYVRGRNYINPAIIPIFDVIEKQVWKEVSK